MRLIDADALLEHVWDADTRVGYVQVVDRQDIENAPTIESPQPEWKSGKWNIYEVANTDEEQPIAWQCPVCEEVVECRYYYCPNCGADMRGGDDGQTNKQS